MKTQVFKLYYFCLMIVTLAFAAHTILVGSMHVSDGQAIATLEKQNMQLTEQKLTLNQSLTQELSFSSITQLAEAQGYTSAQNVISLQQLDQVASR